MKIRCTFRTLCFALALVTALPSFAVAPMTALVSQPDSLERLVAQDLRSALRVTLPTVSLGILQSLQNEDIRSLRNGYIPRFRHHFDDYLQFAPMALQLGMSFGGVKGASSSPLQVLTADALSSVTMLALTSAIKYTARVQRPDGSSRNSFPSGHTAMAFASAEVLNIEYGVRYPWLPYLSYTVAGVTGVGRMMNNRHWLGDVVAGAGLGVFSAHLGYWLTGRIFGDKRYAAQQRVAQFVRHPRWSLELPVQLETGMKQASDYARHYHRQFGLAVLHRPFVDSTYYLRGQVSLTQEMLLSGTRDEELGQTQALELRLGAGRDWHCYEGLGFKLHPFLGLLKRFDSSSQEASLRDGLAQQPSWALTMGLELSPYWHVAPQLGISFPLTLSYRPAGYLLPESRTELSRQQRLHWGLGTALSFYL